jgi:phage major head subunit gpT-like protein
MAIITNALIQALNTGFRDDFGRGFQAAHAASQYERVATIVPSTTASNTYGWLGDMPMLREWIGSRTIKDIKENGYTIPNKNFEGTVGVPRVSIEDDQVGMYRPLMEGLGKAAMQFIDRTVFALLKNGDATACFDGQNFFSAAHPIYPNEDGTGTATTASNFATGAAAAWYLLDVNNVLKPFIWQERKSPQFIAMTNPDDEQVFINNTYRYGVDLRGNAGYALWQLAYKSKVAFDATSYAAARSAMMSLKGDGGRELAVNPTLLVVPPSLEGAARTVLQKDAQTGNPWFGTAEILVSPYV